MTIVSRSTCTSPSSPATSASPCRPNRCSTGWSPTRSPNGRCRRSTRWVVCCTPHPHRVEHADPSRIGGRRRADRRVRRRRRRRVRRVRDGVALRGHRRPRPRPGVGRIRCRAHRTLRVGARQSGSTTASARRWPPSTASGGESKWQSGLDALPPWKRPGYLLPLLVPSRAHLRHRHRSYLDHLRISARRLSPGRR